MDLSNLSTMIVALRESIGPNKHMVLLATVISIIYSMSSLIGLTALVPVVALIAGQDVSQIQQIPYVGPAITSLTDDRTTIFYVMIGTILGLSIVRATLAVCSAMIEADLGRRVDAMWQGRVMDHWIDSSYENHSLQNRGAIMHLTATEVPKMGRSARSCVLILSGGIQIAMALIFLAMVSIEALIGVSIVIAIIIVPISIVVRRNFDISTLVTKSAGSFMRNINDVIKRIDLIDVFGTAGPEKSRLSSNFASYMKSRLKMRFYRSIGPFIVQIFMSAILATLLIYFFNLGATESTLAIVVLFLGGVIIMHPHVDRVGQGFTDLTGVVAAYNAIGPFIQLAKRSARPDSDKRVVPDFTKGNVDIRQLSFSYQTAEGRLPILDDVNLVFEPGSLIMLFGATGAGKTTFLRLLQGLQRPTKGGISYGGVNLAEINKNQIHRTVLMMQQDGLTFTGTVRENVEYGLDNLTDKKLKESLRLAGADKFVRQLSDGVDTNIGNDGALLSGGQRQRVTLARIIAASPPIMLLDEPTSSLDRETEHEVLKSLFRLRDQGHTLIMSTHKVELAPLADTVLWFEGHKIMSGRFEDFQHSLTELIPHDKMKSVLTASSA